MPEPSTNEFEQPLSFIVQGNIPPQKVIEEHPGIKLDRRVAEDVAVLLMTKAGVLDLKSRLPGLRIEPDQELKLL